MSRFSNEMYERLFPRQPEPEKVETAVETFTPTENKLKDSSVVDNETATAIIVPDPELAPESIGKEVEDGHIEPDSSDDN